MSIDFYFKKPSSNKKFHHTQKPDLDNCIKSVTDALNGVAWKDDCQIIRIAASKQFSDIEDKFVLAISEVDS